MSLVDVFVKTLREWFRRPRTMAIILGLPVVFMVVFGLAFGADVDGDVQVAVHDADRGAPAADFIAALEAVDGVELDLVEEDRGRELVEDRDQDVLLVVPQGFSDALTAGDPVPLTLVGDPAFADFGPAKAVVEAFATAYIAEATGKVPAAAITTDVVSSQDLEPFDFIAPGLMVFSILNLAPAAAAILAREVETGTMDRIRLSPLRGVELLGGVAMAHMVLAATAVLLMLLTAEAFGFHNQASFATAYAILLVAALSVTGAAMVIAALAKNQEDASNYSLLYAIPASFLSGAFFLIPSVKLFEVGGAEVGLYDILATTHATEAMRATLTFGDSLADVAGSLAALVVLSILYFAAGLWLFTRRQLRVR